MPTAKEQPYLHAPMYKELTFLSIKLLTLFVFFKLYTSTGYSQYLITYPDFSDAPRLLAPQSLLAMVALHYMLQIIFSFDTTFGTKKFVFWQVFCFLSILIIRSYNLLGMFPPIYLSSDYRNTVIKFLPYFILVHGVLLFIFIWCARQIHKKHAPA